MAEPSSELKSTVAEHYNNLEQRGIEERKQSRIYYLRNLNNWIKSVSIDQALKELKRYDFRRPVDVLDLCCGKGGDLRKWRIGRVRSVVLADIAETSVKQAEERYKEMKNFSGSWQLFGAEFIVADCAEVILTEKCKNRDQMFDLVSCQFSFHYSFETYQRAYRMLSNACERLTPGGIFTGTIPDSYEIMKRLKQSDTLRFGNDVYSITFDSKHELPLFGARYHFFLQEVVDCPEFLVSFPLLQDMASKLGMKLLFRCTFAEFFERHNSSREYGNLLQKMNALEAYPSPNLVGSVEQGEYAEAQSAIDGGILDDGRANTVGTISKSEWEAASLYIVFAFQKEGGGPPSRDDNSRFNEPRDSHRRGGYRGYRGGRSGYLEKIPEDREFERDPKRRRDHY